MDFLYSLGNILILLSLSFRKVLFIRLIFALSDISFLAYGLFMGLTPMVYWSVASLVINFVQIGFLFRDMLPQNLSEELLAIKHLFFESMSTNDFLSLIKLSHKGMTYESVLLEKGNPVNSLMLITNGQVYIDVHDKTVILGPYHFIGEMSYFSDGKASSTIFVREPVDYLYWNYADLHRLQLQSPPLFMKILEAMGKDLMLKMLNHLSET